MDYPKVHPMKLRLLKALASEVFVRKGNGQFVKVSLKPVKAKAENKPSQRHDLRGFKNDKLMRECDAVTQVLKVRDDGGTYKLVEPREHTSSWWVEQLAEGTYTGEFTIEPLMDVTLWELTPVGMEHNHITVNKYEWMAKNAIELVIK
jgi:hypothetical protein